MEFLSLSGRRSSARNVPIGEERGEMDVSAGYVSNSIDLIKCHFICQMLAKFSGLNPKGPCLSLENENFCVVLTYSLKRACEIRKFHIAVVQQRLRNVQRSVMHVQSCSFANLKLSYAPYKQKNSLLQI